MDTKIELDTRDPDFEIKAVRMAQHLKTCQELASIIDPYHNAWVTLAIYDRLTGVILSDIDRHHT
jgi:hypothetical protein